MSYILDALRKADAERERDPARGIHARPAAGAPVRTAPRLAPWTWPLAAVTVAVLAGYFAWGRDEAPATVPVAALPAATPSLVAAPVAPIPVAETPAAPVTPPVLVATSVSPPPPAPVERMATRTVLAPRLPGAPMQVATEAAPARPAAVATPPAPIAPAVIGAVPAPSSAPAAPATPAPGAERILALSELPADIQRDLPKLAITGGVHSDNATQRMLIVGGQVMTEGQELAPGVVLEQIRARSAVLRFRGLRYSVVY